MTKSRQDFEGREDAGKTGKIGELHKTPSKQDRKYVVEVNEPWGNTCITRNELI